MQGRFPAPDPGLGTQYPISFSHPQPPRGRETETGDHIVFRYSKYLHLALLAPLLKLSAAGFLHLLLLCPYLTPWLCLLVIALDFRSHFTYYFCHFLTPSPRRDTWSTSFPVPLRVGVCMCQSLRGRLEAAVVVWPVVRH